MSDSITPRRVEGICAYCGKTFYARSKKAKYCINSNCQRLAWLEKNAEQRAEYNHKWRAEHPKYFSQYLKSEKGKEVQKKRHEKHPLHRKARTAISNGLRLGKIIKPVYCQTDGCNETELEAHHWMGYDKENWLSVQWLCHKHHLEADMKS